MKNIENLNEKGFYVISDCHFFHSRIVKYCNRPFLDKNGIPDVEKMNMTLFKNWNSIIKKQDRVFYLGDFTMGFRKAEVAKILDDNLNGEKQFLVGNHDFYNMIPNKMIKDPVYYVKYKNLIIGMSHYPKRALKTKLRDDCDIFLYGHVHQNSCDDFQSYNCCVENNNYKPIHINKIINILIERNELT